MHVHGTPASQLRRSGGAGWGERPRTGSGGRGEVDCARFLVDALRGYGRDTHLLHDLDLRRGKASVDHLNVDHVVARGRRVVAVDAKRWQPGWYWTLAGRAFCGTRRASYAERASNAVALDVLRRLVADLGGRVGDEVDVTVTGASVVFPAGDGSVRLALYRPADGLPAFAAGPRAARWLRRQLDDDTAPPDELLHRLVALVSTTA